MVFVVGRGPVFRGTLDLAARQLAKTKKPRFSSTESCESDETEEEPLRAPPGLGGVMTDGLMAYFRPPPGLPDPSVRSQAPGGSAQAEGRLLPRLLQIKEGQAFRWEVQRLSLLSWNRPRRGYKLYPRFHVMVQEAETHCEIAWLSSSTTVRTSSSASSAPAWGAVKPGHVVA